MSAAESPTRWRRPLPGGWAFPRLPAVVLDDGDAVVRHGDLVSRHGSEGEERWQTHLGVATGGGEVLIAAAGGVLVTSTAQQGDEPDLLCTLDGEGTALVRTPLGGRVRTGAALARHDVVDVIVSGPAGTACEVVQVATGEVRRRDVLPHGGDLLRAYGERALLTSRSASRDGLGVLGLDGRVREVLPEACWSLDVDDSTVLVTSSRSAAVVGEVQALGADDLLQRWSRPCRPEAAALAGSMVVAAAAADDSVVTGLDAGTGEERWRSGRLPAPVLAVRAVGANAWCAHLSGVTIVAVADGTPLARLDGPWSSPVGGDGRVYAVGGDELVCLDLPA
jgi:outer membrane protein assembly factor BamB